jgi:hypothetical protein
MVRSMMEQGVPREKAEHRAAEQLNPLGMVYRDDPQGGRPIVVEYSPPPRKSEKGRHLKSPTEHQEQRALFTWIDGKKGEPETGYAFKHPDFAWIYAVPNGGYRSIATAAMMKAEGVRIGYADIGWDVPRGRYTGFRGELKRVGAGQLSPRQMEWSHWYERCGLYTCAVEGWEAMRAELLSYYGTKARR